MKSEKILTRQELRAQLAPLVPQGTNVDEIVNGVALALTPPAERTLPVQSSLTEEGIVYAWHEDDASAIKLALEVLSRLGQSFISGPGGIVHLGLAVKELVCFLVDLHRHRVRVDDPLQVAILLLLNDFSAGLTTLEIRERLTESVTQLGDLSGAQIENALEALADADAHGKPKPLVRADGLVWKTLV